MRKIIQTIELPETIKDFEKNKIYDHERSVLDCEWNIKVIRNRIQRYDIASDFVKAGRVLDLFVTCGAMLRTLKKMPLQVFGVKMEEAIDRIEAPYKEYVGKMWDYLRHYDRDWYIRDIEMFPYEIDKDVKEMRKTYQQIANWYK
jgi:hypothetical protein